MASTDSCLAESMKAQVLTTSTSAFSGSRVSSWPASCASPSMTSESTRFLGQPSETRPIFIHYKSIMAVMRKRFALTLALVAVAVATGVANVPPSRTNVGNLLDRFLAADDQPLVSYRAFRHLTASTRGGKMISSIDAIAAFDPQ